jgi:hypothetical protein
VTRSVTDREVQAGQRDLLAVAELFDVVRLGERDAAEQRGPDRHAHTRPRVGELRPVGRMDVGGHVARLADREHGEGVVEVPVGEQHRDRMQVVVGDDLVELAADADAGIDDDALLAGCGREHPAVGGGRLGRETRDEHGRRLLGGRGDGRASSLPRRRLALVADGPRALGRSTRRAQLA